jgi:FixJ family two-component response regulator
MLNPGLHIAIVDDDASIRKALSRLLAASDLGAETFSTGEDFLHALRDRTPDCLMLDLHMPGMTGLDILRALGEAGVELPIIIITGHDEPKAIRRALAAGAAACLRKPLDEVLLLGTINRVCGGARKGLA